MRGLERVQGNNQKRGKSQAENFLGNITMEGRP